MRTESSVLDQAVRLNGSSRKAIVQAAQSPSGNGHPLKKKEPPVGRIADGAINGELVDLLAKWARCTLPHDDRSPCRCIQPGDQDCLRCRVALAVHWTDPKKSE